MDRHTANDILKMLKGYYPRIYPESMDAERQRFIVDDLEESFKKYDNEIVLKAYKEWHLKEAKSPSIADILPIVKDITRGMFRPISQEEFDVPTTYSDYFEDNEGCGYALNSKTHEYDCVWKYWWKKDKFNTLKNLGLRG